MLTAERARKLVELFPSHAALWLLLSAILVVALVTRSHDPGPPPRDQPAAASRLPDAGAAATDRVADYAWLSRAAARSYEPLAARIAPTEGFARVQLEPRSFGDWLRHLPLRPEGSPVLGGDRKPLFPPDAPHLAAVVDLQPGNTGLLHAANIALRLRAEYLWSTGRPADVAFSFTSGDRFRWSQWAAGERPIVVGRNVRWTRSGAPDASRTSYAGFMETLFRYSSVYSLQRDTQAVTDGTIQPGDVFVIPGRPGHAIVVLDAATDASGRVQVLLGQGGTPPQTFFVVRAGAASPWFELRAGADLEVPPWGRVRIGQLRRW